MAAAGLPLDGELVGSVERQDIITRLLYRINHPPGGGWAWPSIDMALVDALNLSWSPPPPLHAAARQGHARCVQCLLDRKDEVFIARGRLAGVDGSVGGARGSGAAAGEAEEAEPHKIRAGPELDSEVVATIPAGKTVVVVSEADVLRPEPTSAGTSTKSSTKGWGWSKSTGAGPTTSPAVSSSAGGTVVRRFKVSFPTAGWVTALNFEPVQAFAAKPRTFLARGAPDVTHKVRSSPDLDSTPVGSVSGGTGVVVVRECTVIKPINGVAAAAVNVLGKQKDGKANWNKLRAAHAEGKLKSSSAAAVAGSVLRFEITSPVKGWVSAPNFTPSKVREEEGVGGGEGFATRRKASLYRLCLEQLPLFAPLRSTANPNCT